MTVRTKSKKAKTAEHRPPARRRRYRHDEVIAGDLFSGFGGLTRGMELAGVTTILAANHNRYKVEIHEANHPDAEHWVCDLVDPAAGDYHSPRDLPKVDWLAAGISCVHHSGANAKKAYRQGKSLFDFEDEDWEERVTRSERDRATAVCVAQYAELHHPRIILVECTTELTSWGPALPNKPKIGDGTSYRWWMKTMGKLGYKHRELYLNSMFFGVPQSRDRIYICFWDSKLPEPNLDHRPPAWCEHCSQVVESVWSWRTGVPPSGRVRWGEQYDYRCPRCSGLIIPPRAAAIQALDFTDLGTRIGERTKPLAASSMERIRRCIERFKEFPAVVMPAKALRGVERHPWQPLATQTSQQEAAILSTGATMVAAGNTFEHPGSECRTRDFAQPLWTQHATNAHAVVTPPIAAVLPMAAGVIPYRPHTIPTTHAEAMPTVTSDQIPAVLAAGVINANGDAGEAKYRAHPVTDPLTSLTSSPTHQLLSAGFFKQNGGPEDTAPHPVSDSLNTLTSRDTTGLTVVEFHRLLEGLTPEECFYRMMFPHEVRRGCGFDDGFKVWGSARDQVDGYGNAVSPSVAEWLSLRLKDIL